MKERLQSSKELNNVELINELLIQATTLHLPIFSLCNINYQSFFGYTYIYIVIITVAFNLFIILRNIGFQFVLLCKMININRNNLCLKFQSLYQKFSKTEKFSIIKILKKIEEKS